MCQILVKSIFRIETENNKREDITRFFASYIQFANFNFFRKSIMMTLAVILECNLQKKFDNFLFMLKLSNKI